MEKESQIKDILPASLEFQAVFIDSDESIIKKPVVCWAVLEPRPNQTIIKGMCEGEHGVAICDDATFYDHVFVGYIGPGEDMISIMPKVEEMRQDLEDEEDFLADDGVMGQEELQQPFIDEDQEYLKQDDFMKHLPMALSQLSVLVREQINGGFAPKEWEQWMDLMLKFGNLIEGGREKKEE